MKIEDFKVGETYLYDGQYEEKVLHIIRQQKKIVTINLKGEVWVFEENELENFKPPKEQLPEEGLLVHKEGTIVYRTGKRTGYGFDSNEDYEILNSEDCDKVGWTFNNFPEEWRKANKQEEEKFIEMLKKECDKRGLFEDTKLSECGINNSTGAVNKGIYGVTLTSHEAWNKNGQIFYRGKFATPLKEETTLELVSKAVKEIGNFTIEQTESGVIILTPIKK